LRADVRLQRPEIGNSVILHACPSVAVNALKIILLFLVIIQIAQDFRATGLTFAGFSL
jgi:hypothetical protein